MPIRTTIILIALLLSSTARADEEEDCAKYSDDLTVLTLAQQCVGEIDFSNPDECWVMWHINLQLAQGKATRVPDWHLVDQLRKYNSVFKVQTPRTLWVLELNLQGVKPPHWPEQAPSWSRVSPYWERIVERAREFLEEPGDKPCSANAYGGACAINGACDHAPLCWVQVQCHSSRQRPFAQAYYVSRKCGSNVRR